jgi:hypothetical protein
LSGQRLSRHEAAVRRVQERRERERAELGRAVAESKRERAAALPDPYDAIARAAALREQGLTVMEALAVVEDQLARTHKEMAARSPERRDEYRRTAEQARTSARRACEVVRKFSITTNPR